MENSLKKCKYCGSDRILKDAKDVSFDGSEAKGGENSTYNMTISIEWCENCGMIAHKNLNGKNKISLNSPASNIHPANNIPRYMVDRCPRRPLPLCTSRVPRGCQNCAV